MNKKDKIKYIFEIALANTPDSPIDIIQILAFNATCKWHLMQGCRSCPCYLVKQEEFYKHCIEAMNEVLSDDMINEKYELYKIHKELTIPTLVKDITNKINVRVALVIHEHQALSPFEAAITRH